MERTYNIPLRKEFMKAPNYKRTAKAVTAVKQVLKKHMKSDDIVIGKYLNQELWKNGPKNPPSKVSVRVVKEENKVRAELVNAPVDIKEIEAKLEKDKKESKKKEEKVEPKKEVKEKKELTEDTEDKTKKEEKVPSALELAEKKTKEKKAEAKKAEKVPSARELAEKKTKKDS